MTRAPSVPYLPTAVELNSACGNDRKGVEPERQLEGDELAKEVRSSICPAGKGNLDSRIQAAEMGGMLAIGQEELSRDG